MSLSADLKNVGTRTRRFFDLALPRGGKIKTLADILGQGEATAERLTRGDVPTVAQMLSLIRFYGRDFVEFVFADVSEADIREREERVGRFLKAVREERENERNAKTRAISDLAGVGLSRPDQLEPGSQGAAAARVVSTRLPLGAIGSFPTLKDHLDRFKARLTRIEMGEAVAVARADANGRIGVVTRTIGDVPRLAYRGRANRLDSSVIGQPVGADDPAYAELAVKTFAEAEASSEPVLARLSGMVRRDGRNISTDVAVLRTVARSKSGLAMSSHFTPLLA